MPEPPTTRNGGALTDDALAGNFRVWQRRRGHRYSLDDVATAFIAARTAPTADSVLDLGTGIGSVLLMLAYKLPQAQLCGIEAQEQSYELLRHNVSRNALHERVQTLNADFRTPALLERIAAHAKRPEGFALVTGTPPYMPPGQGPISPDSQRAHARVELRGGVEDYLAAAARVLRADGRAVVCADARRPERVLDGARAAGLRALERTDVIPIAEHKGALFSVFVLARDVAEGRGERADPIRQPDLVARDRDGGRTEQALELRRFFDLPVDPQEAASPRRRPRSQRSMGE